MISKFCKFLIIFILSISFMRNTYSLDYTAFTGPFSDMFYSITGKNTGTSSFQSLLIPTGGKAEGIGSSYAGLADDIGFFDYNPAASSWIKNTEAALFHNSWIADSAMETLAGTMRLGNLGLGTQLKVFYVPFSEFDGFGDKVASNYYSETSATLNASYHFLPGYKFKGISVGGNIRASWRNIPDFSDNTTGAIIKNSGLEQSGLGLMADLGVLMRFNFLKFYISRDPNFTVGLSIQNLGVSLTGFKSEEGIRIDDPLPTSVSVGASWNVMKKLALSIEFKQPLNLQKITEYQMWSIATGAHFSFTDFLAIMGGIQIKGGNPRITLGGEFELRKVRFNVNYTLDLTSSLNPMNRFSLSAKVNLGDRGRTQKQNQVDALYGLGLSYYAEGNLDKAIEVWKEGLKLDAHFDPLKDAIKSAEAQKRFYQHIIDMQRLD